MNGALNERKKESMKAESTALAGQRGTTCHEERKRKQTQTLNFLPGFLLEFEHVCSLVSSSHVRVWRENRFSEPIPKIELVNFRLSLHLCGKTLPLCVPYICLYISVFMTLPLCVRLLIPFQTRIVPYVRLMAERGIYTFLLVLQLRRRPPVFYSLFLNNVVSMFVFSYDNEIFFSLSFPRN